MANRWDKALALVKAGDIKHLMSPAIDSYHTLWFELPEELIEPCGRTRAQQASEGRAA
jgi:hypothetical protein